MMNLRQILEKSLKDIQTGKIDIIYDISFAVDVSNAAIDIINRQNNLNNDDLYIANLILHISNIVYNNYSGVVLPLDDGIYDQLLVVYKKYHPLDYQVGAEPIHFDEYNNNEFDEQSKLMYSVVQDSELNSKFYTNDIWQQHTKLTDIRPLEMIVLNQDPITKRLINTKHKYPELVGTLDKCKFVLNNDAYVTGNLEKESVQIFERDFIHRHLSQGVIDTYEVFEMIGELKYDGVSVEAEVLGDKIISAYSRGDTAEDIATDLTPIFKNYNFYHAKNVPKDVPFGIKFEAVLTYRNLELLGQMRGKEYKNGRNAIIGLLGASDAYMYTDMITLIPISSSLQMNRIDELNFLNKYYNTGEYNRFCVFHGNYQEILFHVNQFTQSAEIIRKILPYMIDGVVISYTDPNKINILGRVNSVNKYQIAIKFNPRNVRTIFLGYSYNIGKSGEVIPMVHFKPAEFIGTIHTKQTIHSLQRFKELLLVKGQEIDIDYVNDVITYVTKPDTQHNRQLQATKEPEYFIRNCPYCGSEIEISETGKSARCPNPLCPERLIMRMVDAIDKLGFKDFSEETVRTLKLTNFSRLLTPYNGADLESLLGPITSVKFIEQQNRLLNEPIEDFKAAAALCFDGMAEEKWKMILKYYDLNLLFHMTPAQISQALTPINGVGPATIQAIIDGFKYFAEDVATIIYKLKLINSHDMVDKPKVVLTGTRDPMLIDIINSQGYDCSDKYSVTKDTALLVTSDLNSTSGKMIKAAKYGIRIVTPEEFFKEHNIQFGTF